MLALSLMSVALTLLALSSAVYATQPTPASGSWTVSRVLTSVHTADGNTISTYEATYTFIGTFAGPCVGPSVITTHPDKTVTFHGTCTFTGTVGGSSTGSGVLTFAGIGDLTTRSFVGHAVLGDGSAGLAGLHATFVDTGTFGVGATYTGQYHFDPS